MNSQITKIAVIGNGGGGKTTLSRRLAEIYNLPLTHVDSIQFLPAMKTRPVDDIRSRLNEIAAQDRWLIDGFGPLDVMEKRFQMADRVIFVDFHLWRHYWWCTKRQVKAQWQTRTELPEGCNERGLGSTIKLYKTLWRVHKVIRPKLLEIFKQQVVSEHLTTVHNLREWQLLFRDGLFF